MGRKRRRRKKGWRGQVGDALLDGVRVLRLPSTATLSVGLEARNSETVYGRLDVELHFDCLCFSRFLLPTLVLARRTKNANEAGLCWLMHCGFRFRSDVRQFVS